VCGVFSFPGFFEVHSLLSLSDLHPEFFAASGIKGRKARAGAVCRKTICWAGFFYSLHVLVSCPLLLLILEINQLKRRRKGLFWLELLDFSLWSLGPVLWQYFMAGNFTS
jgi:hypothetical protein